jgi:plasmid maintenance system antidote protein VapI
MTNSNDCVDLPRVDPDIVEETALAMAQAEIQNAMDESALRQTDLAMRLGKPRSFISKILSGNHNLTIRTMARLFAACGFELRFSKVRSQAIWETKVNQLKTVQPPVGATPVLASMEASTGVSPTQFPIAA